MIDEKSVKITNTLDFCNLPTEDSEIVVAASEANGLKTCKKLKVSYTRVNTETVYGSESKKITANKNHINNVDKFLRSFFEDSKKSSEDKLSKNESFEQWRSRKCLERVQIMLSQRARTESIRIENADISKSIANLETMASAGKADVTSVAALAELLEKMKKGLSPEDLAKLNAVASNDSNDSNNSNDSNESESEDSEEAIAS